MVILGVIIGIICIILSMDCLLFAHAAGTFVALLPQPMSPEDLAAAEQELAAIDYDNPETMQCLFGPIVEKLEHVNILMMMNYTEDFAINKVTTYDFSKFKEEGNRIIFGMVNTPNKSQDGQLAPIKDVTFYRFEDGVCCWV